MKNISSIIVQKRKEKGFSQEELAERSKLNLRTIQRIENEESKPSAKTLNLVCSTLDIDLQELNKNQKQMNVWKISLECFFLFVLNVLLMCIVGFLTLDVHANFNSRIGAFLLSICLPLIIVYNTSNQTNIERALKFGSGYIFYILFSIIQIGYGSVMVGLIPCCLISLATLYYGKSILGK